MNAQLYDRIITGDPSALRELYDQHIDSALRVATAITKHREHAKDAVQETFIRVFHNISSYQPDQPFKPWFFRILTNECNRILKRESKLFRFGSRSEIAMEQIQTVDPNYQDLYEAIQSLKDQYRIPILLKYIQGFSEKEIAQILDLKHNTVKSRLLKGRAKLKEYIEGSLRKGDQHVR